MRARTPSARVDAAIVLALTIGSAALVQIDRRGESPGPVGTAVASILDPIRMTVSGAARQVRGLWTDYVALADVRAESERLRAALDAARADARRSTELAAENARLRKLLELGDRRKDLRLRAARVVARSTSSYFRVLRITLDVGDGPVMVGMPVIAPGGVVGHVRAVDGGRADVLLVTDPRSAIDVVLEQSRARGVAVGTGEPDRYAARLQYVERAADTQPGERVLATGDDGRYPRGLVVGVLSGTRQRGEGLFQQAEVLPVADFGALEEVFVVLGPSGLPHESAP